MDRKEMESAATELNKALGLKPPISIKQDDDALSKELVTASGLIEPTDNISQVTKAVLAELNREGTTETEAGTEQSETGDVDLNALREQISGTRKLADLKDIASKHSLFCKINLDAHTGISGPKTLKAELLAQLPEAEAAPDKNAQKPATPKKEAAPKRPPRAECAGIVLMEHNEIEFKDLLEKADAMYVEAGGNSNLRETEYAARHAIQFGQGLGILTQEGNTIKRLS